MREALTSSDAARMPGSAAPAVGAEPGTTKVAILFTDMQGSSAFYKEHGNLAGRIMIQKLNDMLFPIVRGYKGTVVKTIGDSIMACFRSAADALWAAVAIQKRLAAHNREHSRTREQLLIRVAVNYGFALVEEKDVFGDAVNVAGKLISACEARQVIITEAFYREVAQCAEVGFSRVDLPDSPGVYRVEWNREADEGTGRLFLLALCMERPSGDQAGSPAGFDRVSEFIERRAAAVVSANASEINAQFRDAAECLQTAGQALRYCMDVDPDTPGLPQIVRIGLHAADAATVRDTEMADALTARASAGPYEIVVSTAMYESLPQPFRQRCIPVKGSPEGDTLYLVQTAGEPEGSAVLAALLPVDSAGGHGAECFYCGSPGHAAGACPSKHIDKAGGYLEKLAYVPLQTMHTIFLSRYHDIVRPMQGGDEDERFEVLFRGEHQDPFALAFFAYYEITACFQLRALSRLYHGAAVSREHPARKTGASMMGADCLRVGRIEEAAGWFEKAVAEQPNDYRSHVALGMLCLEQNRPEEAVLHFTQALSFSLTTVQKCHVVLLLARAHEWARASDAAQREVQRMLSEVADWHEGQYYLGVLLARDGKVKKALEIFKKLIRQAPRYYLMVALNPQLAVVKNEIFSFLNRELTAIRTRARQSLAALQELLEHRRAWFQEDDEDLHSAQDLYHKAAASISNESIAGLMDVPALEDSAAGMLKLSLRYRQARVRKRVSVFSKHPAEHRQYLERYPYRSMLSAQDEKDAGAFEKLLETSLGEADRIPPPSVREVTKLIGRLEREAAKLSARRTRLEWIRHLLVAGECGGKMAGVFAGVAGLTAVSVCGILLLYEGYDSSFAALSSAQLARFFRFGFFAGAVAGGIGSIAWIIRYYRKSRPGD